jgi:hypothetical protein
MEIGALVVLNRIYPFYDINIHRLHIKKVTVTFLNHKYILSIFLNWNIKFLFGLDCSFQPFVLLKTIIVSNG